MSAHTDNVVHVKPEFLQSCNAENSREIEKRVEANAEGADFEGAQSLNFDGREDQKKTALKEENVKNKKRSREERESNDDKLCATFSSQGFCAYGTSCRFSHDIEKYMKNKPPDIGPSCRIFETYGICPSGLTCRFASCHIDGTKSIARKAEDGGVAPLPEKINVLDKKMQGILRKKKFELPKLDKDFSFLPLDAKPRKLVDFSNKVYVAPLTTVGNLPFRKVLKDFGADITCGEMALSQNLIQGQSSEWALFRRDPREDVFGVQVAGGFISDMEKLAALIEENTTTDFVDLNCGCPIDLVNNKGAGCHLMNRPKRMYDIVQAMLRRLPSRSLTVKMRTGWNDNDPVAHKIVPELQKLSQGRLSAIFIHGRSRQQRYRSLADWEYIAEAAKAQDPSLPMVPIIGNGDILTLDDWKSHQHLMCTALEDEHAEQLRLCNCAMIGRGALIKPWLPKEIKDQQPYDISGSERMDMLRRFVDYGLLHWGSDQQGVDNTRRFLLEWLSYLCRYVPAGLVDPLHPQRMNQKPPVYIGRSDTETLLGSTQVSDWVKISEMLLGPVREGFTFEPKHKTSSYSTDVPQG